MLHVKNRALASLSESLKDNVFRENRFLLLYTNDFPSKKGCYYIDIDSRKKGF